MDDKVLEKRLKDIETDLRSYSERLCYNNNVDSEDLYQDTYMKVWVNRHMYKYDDSFRAWCKRIMKNLFIDTVKVENRYKPYFNPQLLDDDNEDLFLFKHMDSVSENTAISEITTQDIEDSINELRLDRDKYIIRQFLTGYSQAEIGDTLSLKENNVKQRIFHIFRELRVSLNNKFNLSGTYKDNISLVAVQKIYRRKSGAIESSNRKRWE